MSNEAAHQEKRIAYGAVSRVLTKRATTYTCVRCGETETTERYPGPTPLYCLSCKRERDVARRERNREQTRERMRALRAGRRMQKVIRDSPWRIPF